MTTNRTYPYTAWTLQPSFKPVQVELIKAYGSLYADYGDLTEAGKLYPVSELQATKAEAIAVGRSRLLAQQAKLDKMQAAIEKRRAALDKAEASK